MKISDCKIGDKVLTASSDEVLRYEEIYMFGHADASAVELYYEVRTETGDSIHLSRNHLIHIGNYGELKAVKDVAIGDIVFAEHERKLQRTRVEEIKVVKKTGAYCPYTTGGSLIVNNILASCYTDIINHQVAHAMLLPARMLYHMLPSRVFNWVFQYDEKIGMPKLLLKIKNFYLWMWGNH